MISKTEGIVLNQHKFSDSKRIVNIFLKNAGKKSFFIKIRNKKSGNLNIYQPFSLLFVEYNSKNSNSISFLKEAYLQTPLFSITSSPEKISIVFFLTEILNKIIHSDLIDENLFDFIKNSILLLENCQNFSNFHIAFLSVLSIYMGIMPEQNFSDTNKFFDIREGLFVDNYTKDYCFDDISSSLFNDFLIAGMNNFSKIKINKTYRNELLHNIINFYSYHFENISNLKSFDVLKKIFE
jgi:DNA repair protein RecO (recombination protein O)